MIQPILLAVWYATRDNIYTNTIIVIRNNAQLRLVSLAYSTACVYAIALLNAFNYSLCSASDPARITLQHGKALHTQSVVVMEKSHTGQL